MPIYEYECDACEKVFEITQRITEEPLSHCPDCSGPVRKLISASAFLLKGGGWYADGYNGISKNSGTEQKACPVADKSADSSSSPCAVDKSTPCSKKDSCPAAA